jgi:hypothetical protein
MRFPAYSLQLDGNPDLYIPPLPSGYLGPTLAYYNIDFNHQAKACAADVGLAPHGPEAAAHSKQMRCYNNYLFAIF